MTSSSEVATGRSFRTHRDLRELLETVDTREEVLAGHDRWVERLAGTGWSLSIEEVLHYHPGDVAHPRSDVLDVLLDEDPRSDPRSDVLDVLDVLLDEDLARRVDEVRLPSESPIDVLVRLIEAGVLALAKRLGGLPPAAARRVSAQERMCCERCAVSVPLGFLFVVIDDDDDEEWLCARCVQVDAPNA